MSYIYYKNPNKNKFIELTYKDFGAAPANHIHQSDTIGIIPISKGGLFNIENNTKNLKYFQGPIIYTKDNYLNWIDQTEGGVYFGTRNNDTDIYIGTPDWNQGAIPYNTNSEQLEHMYRQVPLNTTLRIPKAICEGILLDTGKEFITSLNIGYIIPEGTQSISIAGTYVLRQNGYYLFTNGGNYAESGWEQKFTNKPSMIFDAQTIINSTTEGWYIPWSSSYNRYSGILTLHRISETDQTIVYNYLDINKETLYPAQGVKNITGTVIFNDLKLTFNG